MKFTNLVWVLAFLGVLIFALFAIHPAKADVASAQIQALWAKLATVPDLKAVDQIVIEGPAGGPQVSGVLEKRNWLGAQPTIYWKRFYAKFERTCFQDKPECFVVTGIWSNGYLLTASN